MEIRLPSPLTSIQAVTTAVSSLIAQLRPGQNLTAVVEAQLAENNFLLKLADSGQLIRARSQLDLVPGQILKLQVASLGPTPELRIVPQVPSAPAEAVAVQQALRQFMPRQQGLTDLVSTLQQALTQQSAKDATPLPDSVRSLIRAVLDALPQKKTLLTAEGLRQATRNSGVFFEAQLAAHPSPPQNLSARDLKSRLLALSDALRSFLPTDDADSAQAPSTTVSTPTSDAGATVSKPPLTSPQFQSASEKTMPGTAPTPQQEIASEDQPVPNQREASQPETVKATVSPAPDGQKPSTPTIPPHHASLQESPQTQPSSPPAKGTSTPGQDTAGKVPSGDKADTGRSESGPPEPIRMPSPDKIGDDQGLGKTKLVESTGGKPMANTETATGAAGSDTDKTAPTAESRLPQVPAGTKAPPATEIPARLLTPEPPTAEATAPAAASDVDILPATPPTAGEKNVGAPPPQETGPRADQPSRGEISRRPEIAPPPLADSSEPMVSLRTLQQHTDGAVARIVLDQLSSLPQGDGKQLVWQIEIPFTNDGRPDSAKLTVVREGASNVIQSGQPYWSVMLELRPPGLGTIHSRITLRGEHVDTYFWSDLDSTSALLQDNLDLLAARLQQAGLAIGELNALPGTPPGEKTETKAPAKLVDERA